MIYGKNFNIIHMPKTGGTWLRRVCEKLPAGVIVGIEPHHMPLSEITEERAAFPTYCFVRNPWDWYVSLYGHWHNNVSQQLYEFTKPYGELSPHLQGVHRRFSGSFEQSMSPLLLGAIPATAQDPVEQSFTDRLRFLTRRSWDLKTLSTIQYLRFEDGMAAGLRTIIQNNFGELPPSVVLLLQNHPKENVGVRREGYQSYYNEKIKNWVSRADNEIIRLHKYDFDYESSNPVKDSL